MSQHRKHESAVVCFAGATYSLDYLCNILRRDRMMIGRRWIEIGKPVVVKPWLFVPPYAWKRRGQDLARWEDAVLHAYPRLFSYEANLRVINEAKKTPKSVATGPPPKGKHPGWWERENLPSAGKNGFSK